MHEARRFARRRSRLAVAFGLCGLAALSCERDLEGAPCPCVDGFTCCSEDNRCYASKSSCPRGSRNGGASGAAGTPASSGQAGSAPTGGTENGGASGETSGSGGETSGSSGSSNPSGGGGTSATENGGTAGLGEGGDSASGGSGGDGGTVGPPLEGHAKLPRFCNTFGWCGEYNAFHAVWGLNANDVWVVGTGEVESGNKFGDNALLHWDGRRWLNTPNILLGASATVNAVWGAGPESEVWFVGNDGVGRAIAVPWDGQAWYAPQRIPDISDLRALTGLNRNNIWAVGAEGGIAHWNGNTWSSVPNEVTADLNAIWNGGFSLWAVGTSGTVLYWNGNETEGTTPAQEVVADVDLKAVWGRSSDSGTPDVWVAGDAATLLRWNAGGWSRVDLSNLVDPAIVDFEALGGGEPVSSPIWLAASDGSVLFLENDEWSLAPVRVTSRLNAVWSADTEVWAVGDAGASVHLASDAAKSERDAWIRSPEPVARDLYGVWAASTNDLWAVGNAGAVLHWDGSNWSLEAVETQGNWAAVAGTSSRDVWIVGSRITHFDGDEWRVRLDEAPAMLRSVCAVAIDDAWAVGDEGVILRWNGAEWLPSATFPEKNFKTVWCGATDDVWAIDAVNGVLHWDGESWSEVVDVPEGERAENRTAQILTASAPDDVWLLSRFSNDEGQWLRTNLWNGVNWTTTDETEWSWGIEAAHPTRWRDFWLVGSAIWHASAGTPSESYVGLGVTLHGIWAPREATECDEELGAQPPGPIGAWAVGTSGTLLEKQCIRFVAVNIID